ncbi:WG repeat-containing protein [Fibrella sp. WM1]|uniref:WG repeat-containing protein n=1 Tax=Fibrella musci TaxID=3242485 RepID=UPI00351FB714
MSLDELRERIKNELVLHEGNIADWQWNRTGLPTEARDLGITDFLRLVDDVARPLNAQFSKILDLQAVIRKIATDTQKRLSDVQIGGFALEAERLGLSRSFVTEQWVPRILAQLPDAESTPHPVQPVAPTRSTEPTPPPVSTPDAAEVMRQKVRHSLDDYKEHIPAAVIRTLFRTIDYDEAKLAEAVLAYLRDNFYASETEPTGATLRDKLTSTDWRHLVWWENNPKQPAVATTAPLPPPPVAAPTPPQPAGSTGLRDMLFALLIAGGLIGFVIFLIKSGKSPSEEKQATTDRVDSVARAERTQPDERASRRPKKKRRTTNATPVPDTRANEPVRPSTTTSPRDQPYDELLNDVGQYGERPAKKDGQWGLWRKGRWMVLPVYDAIEVYNDGRARVSINGNSYDIDRNGDRIRE